MDKMPAVKNLEIINGEKILVPKKLNFSKDFLFKKQILNFYIKKFDIKAKISKKDSGYVFYDDSLDKEEYKIDTENGVKIFASSVKGVNRALATLISLIEDGFLPKVKISDKPDFPYRSVMLDLSRQIHPVKFIYDVIDLCWKFKLSYIQLHLSDDQGFCIKLKSFPKLASKTRSYTIKQLKKLNLYAKDRGVEIVPEIDMPGHTIPFMENYPEIFGKTSVLPACERVFNSLKTIYDEVIKIFPDSEYIHVGGDEAKISEWEKCPYTLEYMKQNKIECFQEMYAEYIRVITDYLLEKGVTPIAWEGFAKEYNDKIDRRVVMVSWENYYQRVEDLAKAGFTLINCSWQPLYITHERSWTPEHILNEWDVYNWQHWWEQSKAVGKEGISIKPTDAKVLGAQICSWGDFAPDDAKEKFYVKEFEKIKERIPSLAEKTWNHKQRAR